MRPAILFPLFAEIRTLSGVGPKLEKLIGKVAGPRLVDLDILAFDGKCVTETDIDLIVPHPRLQERRFALEPLAEIQPDLQPWHGCADVRRDVTVADLLPAVADQEVLRTAGPEWADR